jgi:hypothetical protein
MQVLNEARHTLEGIVRQRYSDAARTRDHANLLRYLKLYKPLRMQVHRLTVATRKPSHQHMTLLNTWGDQRLQVSPTGVASL